MLQRKSHGIMLKRILFNRSVQCCAPSEQDHALNFHVRRPIFVRMFKPWMKFNISRIERIKQQYQQEQACLRVYYYHFCCGAHAF